MSKGGGSTTKQELPPWLEDAAKQNLARASMVSDLGYVPYYGNDVAAFSPMQQQAMMNTGSTAQAFGMAPAGFDPMAGMPKPTTDNLGFSGYSSGDMFDQSMDQFQQRRPAQYDYMNSMFIDPQSGQMSQFNQNYISDELINQGVAPEVARAAVSGDGSSASNTGGYDYGQMSSGTEDFLLGRAVSNPANALLGGNPLSILANLGLRHAAGNAIDNRMDAIQNQIDQTYQNQQNGILTAIDSSGNVSNTYSPSTFGGSSSGAPAWNSSGNVYDGGGWGSSDDATTKSYSSGYGSLGVGGGNASRGYTTGGW